MGTENATDRITNELQSMIGKMSGDLDRIEILTAALAGFSRPVPDYEPTFHHLNLSTLREHELGTFNGDR